MLNAILDILGVALCYILAGILIVSVIILVCGAFYVNDKANKKY